MVLVVVDSNDKYTKRRTSAITGISRSITRSFHHQHKRQTPCAARYVERYVHSAIAEGAKKQHPCPASSSSSYSSSSSSSSRGVVVIFESFGIMGFGVDVVGVDSRDKYTKNENVMNHERPQDKSYQYILKLAVLDLEHLLLRCRILCTPSWSRSNYRRRRSHRPDDG